MEKSALLSGIVTLGVEVPEGKPSPPPSAIIGSQKHSTLDVPCLVSVNSHALV
jgi:hypothetical protein